MLVYESFIHSLFISEQSCELLLSFYIKLLIKLFEKVYTTNWKLEVFTVTEVQSTHPYTYKLEDARGEKVIGTFYEPELQLAKPQPTFKIEKVLRKRTTKAGKKELYVKWLGYSKDFNQWIPAEDLEE